MIMGDAVVEGSGNCDPLVFLNVHPNLSTQAYNISASIGNAAAAAGIQSRYLRSLALARPTPPVKFVTRSGPVVSSAASAKWAPRLFSASGLPGVTLGAAANMTIIVFLVDTSASMNQRTYLGARLSVLDVAKDAVERFIKIRQRDSASRGDRYMLLTFEEPPANIKAGWKENHATFMAELKNLQASGLTTLGPALKNAFDLLNINRMQTGIDTYGQGRCPFYLEPSVLVVITDGNRLTSSAGVHEELTLPMHSAVPGSELTKEPFRWDQRMFALVLRMAGTQAPSQDVPLTSDASPIDDMCEVTGGSGSSLMLVSLTQVRVSGSPSEPLLLDNLPFDKYELEPSPLTQAILGRKQPTVAFAVSVAGAAPQRGGSAFGYLKASSSLACVNLFVLPYNYTVLLPLLDELFRVHRCKPPAVWAHQTLVPDSMENCLSYTVLNYLKRLKNQAKAEYEKVVSAVGGPKTGLGAEGVRVSPGVPRPSTGEVTKLSELALSWNPALRERLQGLRQELSDFSGFALAPAPPRPPDTAEAPPRNPFDISRASLLHQVARMRARYLHPGTITRLQDAEQLHNLPVSQMGNYQEYLKRMPTPLREIESTPVRQHMFGNPFKIEKRMMVDEADLDPAASQARGHKRPAAEAPGGPRAKRRPGPLPRNFTRSRSPMPSPPSTPEPATAKRSPPRGESVALVIKLTGHCLH
ncbi:hypothetical protein HPB51_009774 [Rhipicephalus microplus]|uniref:VWFA domain-containing protein n=1 Tax=Rhipicephalus microplus TaxID=6941 RepID=A0A9J6F0G1_RHIMP|nr:hypothetical protein HPB51_009774 [Rhipicephalus microplus]